MHQRVQTAWSRLGSSLEMSWLEPGRLELSVNGLTKQSSHLVYPPIAVFKADFLVELAFSKCSDQTLVNEWVWLDSLMYLGWLRAILCPVWAMETQQNLSRVCLSKIQASD